MAQFVNIFDVDLQAGKPNLFPLNCNAGEGDANGFRVGARVTDGGEYIALGGSCVGKVVRADGATVPLTGTISGNLAYVVLDQASCAVEGPIEVSVIWASGGNKTMLLKAYGTVIMTETGNTIQPSTPIPDLTELLAEIDEMRAATAAANAAANGALANFAGAFSDATAYTAGQYVTYTDGYFYRFTADHAAGAWSSSDVERVTTGEELSGLQSAVNAIQISEIAFTDDGYIKTYGTYDSTVYPSNNWRYARFACTENDSFVINAKGSSPHCAYAFINANNETIAYGGRNATLTNELVIAPAGSALIVINDNKTGGHCYKNIPAQTKELKDLENEVNALEDQYEADVAALGNRITENTRYIGFVSGNEYVPLTTGGYIVTNTDPVNPTPVSHTDWKYAIISCSANDLFTIRASYGSSSGRVWCFTDSSYNVITVAASTSDEQNAIISAPVGAAYLIYNTKNNGCLIKGRMLTDADSRDYQAAITAAGLTEIEFVYSSQVPTGSSGLGVRTVAKEYKSAIVNCTGVDVFIISGIGGNNDGVSTFAFYDSSDALIWKSGSVQFNNQFVKAPGNAAKIVINIRTTTADTICYQGALRDKLTEIPYYYGSYMDTAIASINAMTDSSGLSGDTFVFITDYHVQVNARNSAPLINKIMNETGTHFIVFGGDAQDYESTFAAAVAENEKFKTDYEHLWGRMFNVIGNHEFNTHDATTQDSSMVLSYNQVYNFFQKQRELVYGAVSAYGDYYIDNPAQKIRYFFIGCTAEVDIKAEQRDWLFTQFLNVPDGYLIIVFSHLTFKYVPSDNSKIFVAGDVAKIAQIMTEYNARMISSTGGKTYDYTNAGGEAVAIIGGHTHYDASTEYSNLCDSSGNPIIWGYVPIIATTTDAIGRQQSNTGTLTREYGTTTEQAFDVVHIDRANRKIIMKRIGAGSDREFDFMRAPD